MWLKFSQRILLSVLQKEPSEQVTEPTRDELHSYIEAIGLKYPILAEEKVLGATDSLKILLQTSTVYGIQINITTDGLEVLMSTVSLPSLPMDKSKSVH